MKLKKLTALCLAAGLVMTTLGGCGSKPAEPADTTADTAETAETETEGDTTEAKSDVKLSFMTNVVGEKAEALETAIKGFEEETGYTVEFSAPGSDYEELMKVKMGANELPDVFTTHGWSVARYSDYLMPVNDMSFFGNIDPQILPAITAANGDVYVLPVDVDIAGICYNVDVLDKCGVDVDSIKTWEDFTKACGTIKENGYEPIHMGGKDSWTIGQYFDWAAPSFYVTDDSNNQKDALKAGTFDTDTWEAVSNLMKTWVDNGYFNEDVLTADYNADMDALANGETAFCFYGNSAASDAHAINADTKIGMMPIPSNSASDEPSLITGEDIAVGVWKDSKYTKEATELLEYLARPEVAGPIASTAGNKAGLKGVTSDIGDVQTYLDKYADVETFPYFDREYLPSGLWDTMCLTGVKILAGDDNAVKDAAVEMKGMFDSKYVAK